MLNSDLAFNEHEKSENHMVSNASEDRRSRGLKGCVTSPENWAVLRTEGDRHHCRGMRDLFIIFWT